MKVGKHIYIYEVCGFRDANGNSRNKKHPVGKIDPRSGEPVYKPEYIAKMADAGSPVKLSPRPFEIADIRQSAIKEYGSFYFLHAIAELIGLKQILSQAMTSCWQEIFTLASYLICSEDPFMYCEHWVETNETLPTGSLSSQRISELLHAITVEERTNFYRAWGQYRSEREYLALDITSISSWSYLIEDVEWGYNRDGEKLPQVNLCMLMGEQSKLPVFQTLYCGSLKDVSTLETTVEEATAYSTHHKKVLLVMDKGFYSAKNLTILLNHRGFRFIMPVPFTVRMARELVRREKDAIDTISHTLVSGKHSVRAVGVVESWETDRQGCRHQLYTHLYFNPLKAAERKEELYAHVALLVQAARENPKNKKFREDFTRYLSINPKGNGNAGCSIKVRHEVLEKELETSGWLVLVSNRVKDPREALSIYRAKDVVEKGFFRLKNSIDLERLRIHSWQSMQNKAFIGFVSIILLSHINKVMLEKGLYKKFTIKSLILTLKKLRIQYINGQPILFPVTKEQKMIFDAFSILEPRLS
jgi:transposase